MLDLNLKTKYLGKIYPVFQELKPAIKKDDAKFISDKVVIYTKDETYDVQKILERFYKRKLKILIQKRIALYQKHFKDKPRELKIVDTPGRWGSCNSSRVLTFNKHLIAYDLDCIDYVVVHEMCHMAHLNHSRSFWRDVGKIHPNYMECAEILGSLKEN